jgi:thioredoxin reductase (NADPH)
MEAGNPEPDFELTVVGGGIAGAACALRAAQYGLKTAWIMGNNETAKRSRSMWVRNVDNMIGVHSGIVLSELRRKWKKDLHLLEALDAIGHLDISTMDIIRNVQERLWRIPEMVEEIKAIGTEARRLEDGTFEIKTSSEKFPTISSYAMVLATGIMDRQPLIKKENKGKIEEATKWIYPFANKETVLYCVRCEGHLTMEKSLAVIGATETTCRISLMLSERYNIPLIVLTNGEELQASPDVRKLMDHYGIQVRTARIVDVHSQADGRGQLRSLELEDGEEVIVQFALVSLGLYKVYNDLALQIGAEMADTEKPVDERRVKVDHRSETSVENFFAVGDLSLREDEGTMMQIYTAQEFAVRAVDTIDRRRRDRERSKILANL